MAGTDIPQLPGSGGGGGGGTQYVDGTANSTPTGNVIEYKDGTNTLRAVSPSNPLPVTGGGGGTQYADGASVATPTGTQLNYNNGGTQASVSKTKPLPTAITDPSSGAQATVAQYHNADNQSIPGSTYSTLSAGVAQLKNAAGNSDRQVETGTDNIPALGIATGTAQLASPFSTTIATSITSNASPQAVTPAAMSGTVRGGAWSIQVGSVLNIDTSTNKETVVVTAVTSTTFSAIFTKNHTGPGIAVNGFTYNQAKDATVSDGATGVGFAAGATYLFNPALNSGAGGWEASRSALGGEDNASGAGLPPATEYEYNGVTYDRARNLQSKGYTTNVITSGGGVGSTSVTLQNTPTGLQPGSPILLLGGNQEYVYTSSSYVPGANPVTLQSAITQTSHTSSGYEVFVPAGPRTNGFLPTGLGIEEECIYDPVTDLYYLERAATQDGVAGANLVLEGIAAYNGSTFDRVRGSSTRGLDTNLATALNYLIDTITVYQAGYSQANISTATTTTVKSTAGTLHTITLLGGTAGSIVIYDNTTNSGTVLVQTFTPGNVTVPVTLTFDLNFSTGLTIVTGAATLINISYR